MIRIHLTGTREEINKAISITREGYTVISRSKPHKAKTDASLWNISLRAEFKATDVESQNPSVQGTRAKGTPDKSRTIS